jgi:hypothetical protein
LKLFQFFPAHHHGWLFYIIVARLSSKPGKSFVENRIDGLQAVADISKGHVLQTTPLCQLI